MDFNNLNFDKDFYDKNLKEFIKIFEREENSLANDTSELGEKLKTLEGYESLLNIPKLITEEDAKEIERDLTHTDEYIEFVDSLRHSMLYPSEDNKAWNQEAFEELQNKVAQRVMETYQEKLEEYRDMGLKAKDIDELAISFKDGTWTFTPLHIEDDGTKSIAAHSCKIELSYVLEKYLEKYIPLERDNDEPKPRIVQAQALLETFDGVKIATIDELERDNRGMEL